MGWGLYLEDGKIRLNMSTRVLDDGLAAETLADVALNQWQHVVATYDGSKTPDGVHVYVDGRRQAMAPLNNLVGNRLNVRRFPLRIGASGSDKPRFEGRLDDVRIYARVLTPTEAAVAAVPESLSDIATLAPAERSVAQTDKLRFAFLDQYAPPEVQEAGRQVAELQRQRDELWAAYPTVMVMTPRSNPPRIMTLRSSPGRPRSLRASSMSETTRSGPGVGGTSE